MQFALELYLHRQPKSRSEQLVARARAAAPAEQHGRAPLVFLRSIYLPGDEICFLVFEAPSAEAVAEAARQADITFERVVEAELLPSGSVAPNGS